ncbi:class I SAM-dependent methyltransferase [archaeon]|nr:class I SAM-dependent methyltransferase [Nanoarchaeota archaeon]MCG2723801.1 class I SAM-dependent methyltransferase [archaeon]
MKKHKKNERVCPICKCSEKTHLYKQNFNNDVISPITGYDVVVCKKCGFAYADNIPQQNKFNDYYALQSKWEFNYRKGVVSNEYINHFTKIFNFLNPHLKNHNARIVDIGCSTGGLLSIFKTNGYSNLLGLDPSPSCAKTTMELYNIKAIANNIFDFKTDEKFDLITLSAVLEHLVDLDNSMQKIKSLLKEDGLLFLEIPDAERFEQHIIPPFQHFSTEHINYFSKESIRNLLAMHSFKILELQQTENRTNRSIDPDIFVLSKNTNAEKFKLIHEDVSEIHLRNYITKSNKYDLETKKSIHDKLLNKDKIIVWGVGTHTQRLLSSGLDLSKIVYFVDSNAKYSDKKLKGIEIKTPGDIREEDIPILISSYSYQEEIAHQIKEVLKLNNEIIKLY